MIHPLVTQLRFARSEFARCFENLPPEDACRRIEPLNCLSWAVGHLASQEHFYWIQLAQGREIAPGLRDRVGFRQPASPPPWGKASQSMRPSALFCCAMSITIGFISARLTASGSCLATPTFRSMSVTCPECATKPGGSKPDRLSSLWSDFRAIN